MVCVDVDDCHRQDVRAAVLPSGSLPAVYLLASRVSRYMLLGSLKKLQLEDYLMLLAMVRPSDSTNYPKPCLTCSRCLIRC